MRFARDRARYAAPTANLILAGADTVEGKTEAGLAHLEKAIAGFVAAEMGYSHCLASAQGGAPGRGRGASAGRRGGRLYAW